MTACFFPFDGCMTGLSNADRCDDGAFGVAFMTTIWRFKGVVLIVGLCSTVSKETCIKSVRCKSVIGSSGKNCAAKKRNRQCKAIDAAKNPTVLRGRTDRLRVGLKLEQTDFILRKFPMPYVDTRPAYGYNSFV